MENQIDRSYLFYKTSNKKMDKLYDFGRFEAIRSFGREI